MTRQQNIRTIFLFSLSILNIFLALPVLAEDTLTITTYYPSPYGVYRELRAKRIAIGDDYIDGANYTWQDTESGSGEVGFNADLVVEGNVGIGTVNPGYPLTVGSGANQWYLDTTGAMYGQAGYYSLDRSGLTATTKGGAFTIYNNANTSNSSSLYIGSAATNGNIELRSTANIGSGDYVKITGGTNGGTEIARFLGTGNVGIGTASPVLKMNIVGTTGLPATSGTAQVGMLRLSPGDAYGSVIDIGQEGPATGKAWIQSTNKNDLNITYPLLVNPNGGNVGIGTTSPTATLQVKGTMKVFGDWVDKSSSYGAQQAATDGFLVVSTNSGANLQIYTDSSSNPTTLRAEFGVSGAYVTGCCPVKKGDYWKVVATYGSPRMVYWIPLGTS